jgi:hypothetical protein
MVLILFGENKDIFKETQGLQKLYNLVKRIARSIDFLVLLPIKWGLQFEYINNTK